MTYDSNSLKQHFANMWQIYTKINSDAKNIHELFSTNNPNVVNDHIALRTYNIEAINIKTLSSIFVKHGYVAKSNYKFKNKHLLAQHFEHPDTNLPKIFISALQIEALSSKAQTIIKKAVSQIPQNKPSNDDFCYSGTAWDVNYNDYKVLLKESEYAAWLLAFGFIPNHFTVSVNHLDDISEIHEVNQLLKDKGFNLNTSGGEIKGSPQYFLEQSSTTAKLIKLKFTDKEQMIPGCYYEFAKRYKDKTGRLFQGFVTKSADKIFESTDVNLSKQQS